MARKRSRQVRPDVHADKLIPLVCEAIRGGEHVGWVLFFNRHVIVIDGDKKRRLPKHKLRRHAEKHGLTRVLEVLAELPRNQSKPKCRTHRRSKRKRAK